MKDKQKLELIIKLCENALEYMATSKGKLEATIDCIFEIASFEEADE